MSLCLLQFPELVYMEIITVRLQRELIHKKTIYQPTEGAFANLVAKTFSLKVGGAARRCGISRCKLDT